LIPPNACKEVCDLHLPDIIEGKAHNTSSKCMRCPVCIENCVMDAISYTDKENLSKALASAAYGVLSTFKPKKLSYISFAKDITQGCDCLPNPGEIKFKDVGIFASDSAVSIDAAFLQSIDYSVFNEAAEVDCMVQLKEARALGIEGEIQPEIKRLK
jgi:uncharacterized protein